MPSSIPADGSEAAAGRVALPSWPFLESLSTSFDAGPDPVSAFRRVLADGDQHLRQRFSDDESVEMLVRDRARMVDLVLRRAWSLHAGAGGTRCGPGRGRRLRAR